MEWYVFSMQADKDKKRVIHTYTCTEVPDRKNRIVLGRFETANEALDTAHVHYGHYPLHFKLCPLCCSKKH
ncbi:hypothetical protein [Listeria costaricensis]|uniref:hypothetical protein n=1 Tax=Listeria costaricensis TaxID=2026604 RepID=UPI0013C4A5A6|nr:hypothetical protein [Listeria costaricensis]